MIKLDVSLKDYSYQITIASGLLKFFSSLYPLSAGDRAMIVTDQTLAPLYLQQLLGVLAEGKVNVDTMVISSGEQYKNLDTAYKIFTSLLQTLHCRDTTLIALGGGVIGDVVGFVAATYKRGVRLIQIPTTLLSQVDSSVGGKTAVNHPLGKNMIGTFYQPNSVVIDINFLHSLPVRQLCSGLAEVIKYAIIFDTDFFTWLEDHISLLLRIDERTIIYCIHRCCQLKARVVASDERDSGQRMLLNLGHTFGHAIESYMGYESWLHGEAVSVGIVIASRIARDLGKLKAREYNRIITLLENFSLPIRGPKEMSSEDYFPYIAQDKKVTSRGLNLILPLRIGHVEVYEGIQSDAISLAINST
jgi:3-dehydroquinate synthase